MGTGGLVYIFYILGVVFFFKISDVTSKYNLNMLRKTSSTSKTVIVT